MAPSCRDMDCLCCRSYGPIGVFFRTSCSWRSEGLFGQSFSVALPIQALQGFLCPGSFSVVQHVRHIEDPPPTHSRVLLCSSVRQAFDGPASIFQLLMLACGEREAMVMAPPSMRDSAVSPCFCGYLTFFHWHFPPLSPPSHPFGSSICSQQQP